MQTDVQPSPGRDWLPDDVPQEPDPAPLGDIGERAIDIRESTPPEPDWLVPGVIARGWTVQLSAREKVGKGTLVMYLLGCLERGEPTVFGETPHRVTSLIYTEEPDDSLRAKLENADLAASTVVFHHELAKLPSWGAKVEWLVRKAVHDRHDLIFVDNVSRATGIDEEAGVALARAVEPLSSEAKRFRLAVLLDHHQRKTGGKIEDLFRGGTALVGATENNLAMVKVGGTLSRKRRLVSRGRVSATIWDRTVELSENERDYVEADPPLGHDGVLLTREQWTVKEFAAAIGRSQQTARDFLNASDLVDAPEGKTGVEKVYRVVTPPSVS